MASHEETKTVGVLQKAITIIKALEDTQKGIGIREIAEKTSINRTTCHRILQTLLLDNMVEMGEKNGMYRLGMRMLELGSAVQRRINLRQLALPILTKLTNSTGETSFLCLNTEDRAVCLERIEGKNVQVLAMRVGDSWPLYQGAAPRAILTHKSDQYIRDLLTNVDFERKTANTPPDASTYWKLIMEAREKGYTTSREDVTLGVASIGAPIFDHEGKVIAAVSISSTVHRIYPKEKNLAYELKETATNISGLMGWKKQANENE